MRGNHSSLDGRKKPNKSGKELTQTDSVNRKVSGEMQVAFLAKVLNRIDASGHQDTFTGKCLLGDNHDYPDGVRNSVAVRFTGATLLRLFLLEKGLSPH